MGQQTTFGEIVRNARRRKLLTQPELAELVGYGKGGHVNISKLETGQILRPRPDTMYHLCRVLELDYDVMDQLTRFDKSGKEEDGTEESAIPENIAHLTELVLGMQESIERMNESLETMSRAIEVMALMSARQFMKGN